MWRSRWRPPVGAASSLVNAALRPSSPSGRWATTTPAAAAARLPASCSPFRNRQMHRRMLAGFDIVRRARFLLRLISGSGRVVFLLSFSLFLSFFLAFFLRVCCRSSYRVRQPSRPFIVRVSVFFSLPPPTERRLPTSLR